MTDCSSNLENSKDFDSEVRCEEKAKGGLRYELVLAQPSPKSEAPRVSSPPPKSFSELELAERLRAAEERRQSLELQRINQINEQLSHLEMVREKKEEFNMNFMQTTRESLEQKMEAIKENREAYLQSIKDKVREHAMKVEEVKKASDPSYSDKINEATEKLQRKLEAAAASREEQMNSLMQRLREHDKHIGEVHAMLKEKPSLTAENLKQRNAKKLQVAQEKREAFYKYIQEKSQEHEKHINEIRKQYEDNIELLKEKQIKKQENAKEKREAALRDIQEKILEHQSHVLQVRQLNIMNQQSNETKVQQTLSEKLSAAESKRSIQFHALQEKLLQHERHAEEVRRKAGSSNNTSMVDENKSG